MYLGNALIFTCLVAFWVNRFVCLWPSIGFIPSIVFCYFLVNIYTLSKNNAYMMLQITLMDPYMWVDLSPHTKLSQINNNKSKTKKKIK